MKPALVMVISRKGAYFEYYIPFRFFFLGSQISIDITGS